MQLTISLNDERIDFLERCIQSGTFASHDAVIDTALLLMSRYADDLIAQMDDDVTTSLLETFPGHRHDSDA